MSQPFARSQRLTKTDEYSSVFGFRRAIRGQWLMLHYQPRAVPGSEARLGMVIGKKLLRRAVDRNRVKRCIRECFRRRRPALPACDLIVRLISRPGTVDDKTIAVDLQVLFDKLPGRLRSLAEAG